MNKIDKRIAQLRQRAEMAKLRKQPDSAELLTEEADALQEIVEVFDDFDALISAQSKRLDELEKTSVPALPPSTNADAPVDGQAS